MISQLEQLCQAQNVGCQATLMGIVSDIGGAPHTAPVKPGCMFRWKVKITFQGRSETFDYYTGLGHVNKPPAVLRGHYCGGEPLMPGTVRNWHTDPSLYAETIRQAWYTDKRAPLVPVAADVLSCVVSDAHAGGQSFTEFCSDFGYDEDSRKAHKVWRKCKDGALKAYRLLGSEFETFAGAEH